MFDEDNDQQQNRSTNVPLHLDRNIETVVSGLTNVTWESAHTSLVPAATAAASQRRGGRFRSGGGTLTGITEAEEDESVADDATPMYSSYHPTTSQSSGYPVSRTSSHPSTGPSLNNNGSSHGGSVIAGSGASVSSASYYSQPQQRRPNRHSNNYLNRSAHSTGASVISSATSSSRRRYNSEYDSSTQNTSSVINSSFTSTQPRSSFASSQPIDNRRLISHNPKSATAEVNVADYQESIHGDETSSLPDDYFEYDDDTHFRRKHKNDSDATITTTTKSHHETEMEVIPIVPSDIYKSPFSRRRRWYSLVSVLAAFLLAVVGLKLSVDSLTTTSSIPSSSYLPGYRFGGGVGGLAAGQERDRRMDLAYSQYGVHLAPPQQHNEQLSSSPLNRVGREPVVDITSGRPFSSNTASYNIRAPSDPFQGFGPPQFNVEYDSAPNQASILADLSSAPLTSYIPPPNDPEDVVLSSSSFTQTVIDPMFHGSMMDLSHLPYHPINERAVVWDVPLSGTGSLQTIFGSCLHMVQCNHDYSQPTKGSTTTTTTKRRSLMDVVTRDDVKAAIAQSIKMKKPVQTFGPEAPLHPPTEEDPDLKTEFQRFSTYVNVDCSSPEGIDRGIAHDLAESDLVDVFYSKDPYDLARLFAPPKPVYGRGIVMVRNPIRRAVATYKRLQMRKPDMVKDMTLEQFALSDHLQDNFLTRTLSRNRDAPLTQADLNVAKEVLKRKFVVGLYDDFEESVHRFEAFFGWKLIDSSSSCQSKIIQREMDLNYNDFDSIPYDSAYTAIAEKNREDLELYKYAEYLYQYQKRVLFGNAEIHDVMEASQNRPPPMVDFGKIDRGQPKSAAAANIWIFLTSLFNLSLVIILTVVCE